MKPNEFELQRNKHRPGDLVQRFGDHRKKHEPTVLLPNQVWEGIGKPDVVTVQFSIVSEYVSTHDGSCNDYTGCNDNCISVSRDQAVYINGAWRQK